MTSKRHRVHFQHTRIRLALLNGDERRTAIPGTFTHRFYETGITGTSGFNGRQAATTSHHNLNTVSQLASKKTGSLVSRAGRHPRSVPRTSCCSSQSRSGLFTTAHALRPRFYRGKPLPCPKYGPHRRPLSVAPSPRQLSKMQLSWRGAQNAVHNEPPVTQTGVKAATEDLAAESGIVKFSR